MEFKINKDNWEKVTLGDVVFEPKETAKDIIAEGFEHIVGLEHIDSGDVHLRNSFSMDTDTTFTKVFKAGDVLFGRRRAYLKKAAQATFDGVCSSDITVMRANDKLDVRLLPFVIHNDKFFDYAVKHSAGGLSPRVKFKDLANYEFLLPPKELQAELAELLWAMDTVIEKDLEVLERLKELKVSIINEEIIGNLSKGEWSKLSDYFEPINTKNKKLLTDNVLTISAELGLVNQEEYFTRNVASKDLSNYYLLHRNDFTYNKSYSKGYPAGVFRSLENYDIGVVSPLYIVFRLKENLDSDFNIFFKHFFDSGFLNSSLLSIAKEGARNHGLLNISKEDFYNLKIPQFNLNKLMLKKIDDKEFLISQSQYKLQSSKALQKALINQIF